MRSRFDEQLTNLNNKLIEMGAMIEDAITKTIRALIEQDVRLAKSIIAGEEEIDQMERDIESLCLKLLLQQQPIAKDLRLISSALKMITDMERIGDHAEDISEITLFLAGTPYIKELEHIPQMAEATVKMVKDAIDAFVKRDLELAYACIDYDEVVDNLFINVKNDLIDLIRIDSANGEQAIDLLMIAKYFERIGDHATNIAEWVVFSLTGNHKRSRDE
ncbi:MAG: phosphate signaling complex protein PhoU [Clostridiales bacterium]|jgi:phosphate transport system protein|nr:phosphate signaling complex protein PhoU [Clostridiales bacterium]